MPRRLELHRRTLIRGAGSIAIALPWLEAMGTRTAGAQSSARPANRFLGVFTPGGTAQTPLAGVQRHWPGGSETAPVLSQILAPMEPVKSKIITIRGLRIATAEVGDVEPHPAGSVGLWSGSELNKNAPYSSLPSIDQVIATRISKGKKAKASVLMAVRWATDNNGKQSAFSTLSSEDPTGAPIPPSIDPVTIYQDLFGALAPAQPGRPDPVLARRKSILDFVDRKYVALSARLGAADRAKLEQHLDKLREVEKGLSLSAGIVTSGKCQAPPKVDTSKYNPKEGMYFENETHAVSDGTDGSIPLVGKYMMDMMVMAFACDITGVGVLSWSDAQAFHSLPWLNLPGNQHTTYQHDKDQKYVAFTQIATWYHQQHSYLLQQMDGVDMGGHTLLDESVVFFGSDVGVGMSHSHNNIPIMLAGGGGGLRTGRHLDLRVNRSSDDDPGIPHNNLLVAVLRLFGDTRTTYQQPGRNYCNNPITNLT